MLIKSRLHDTIKGNKFQKCVIIRKMFFWYSNQLNMGATQETINLIMTCKEDKLVSLNSSPRYGRLKFLTGGLNSKN